MSEPFEKVDLPSGGWATFRDPASLTERQRRPLKRAWNRVGLAANLQAVLGGDMSPAELDDSEVDLLEGLMESVVVVLVDDWSFEDVIDEQAVKREVNVDTLTDLNGNDYESLIDAARKHRTTLIPNFEPTAEQTDEAGSENPTGLSPESKTSSEESQSQVRSPTATSEPGSS